MIVRETPALVRACPVKPHIGAFNVLEGENAVRIGRES